MSDAEQSPGDALRRKLAERRDERFADFDRDFIRFAGRANSLAMQTCRANAMGDDGGLDTFCRALYDGFRSSGADDVDKWLRENLPPHFLSICEPPQWIEQEPSWAFYEGRPMVFISQTPLTENDVTINSLGIDQTLYLFGIRIPRDGGFELHYKVITQFDGLS